MATESDLENEMSPVDFIQLQDRTKAKDEMKEFHAGGKLVHHGFGDTPSSYMIKMTVDFLIAREVDRVVTQMMHAAEHLGLDVKELKPVLRVMLKAIDINSSDTVTQQEWIQGGLNNIPLLVLLGLKIHITHRNQANMLMTPAKSLGCFPK